MLISKLAAAIGRDPALTDAVTLQNLLDFTSLATHFCRMLLYTRYYPTYYTHDSRDRRTYYLETPYLSIDHVEVLTHYYMEKPLAERLSNTVITLSVHGQWAM